MSSSSKKCDIYLTRHGETDWNFQDLVQGQTDIPLNATGISQALQLRELLADIPFSAAFSSDLSRAQLTAELIVKPRQLRVKASPALRERSAGTLEGVNKHIFDEKIRPFLTSAKALHHETYLTTPWHPEIETTHSVLKRVSDFLFPLADLYPNQSLLVVSHGGVLRSILDYLSFTPTMRWMVDNCGFIKIELDRQKMKLLDYHRVFHKPIG
ncbi:MAG: histidine phosphatase family protein [Parachlamydiaceae bacterium]